MSTKTITICHCDRCGRRIAGVDHRPDSLDLDVDFWGTQDPPGGVYPDLCLRCIRTVSNLLDRVFLRKKPEQAKAAK